MSRSGSIVVALCMLVLRSASGNAQRPDPILDMHLHARAAAHYGPPPQVICAPVDRMPVWDPAKPIMSAFESLPCRNELRSPMTDSAVMAETIATMERWNVFGVLGGSPGVVGRWVTAAPGRFIPGLDFRLDREGGTASAGGSNADYRPISPDSMRTLFATGRVAVLAEVLNQYGGIAPDDPRMDAYWRLAEELDVPVGIHLGPGSPGEFYLGNDAYRAGLQNPLTLEPVLIRHPRLRVYIMHAGYPFLDDLIALLFAHPQVYVEISMLVNVEPRAGFYRYLQAIIDAGYIDRVMFGSDQMVWPGLIDAAVRSIEDAAFLSAEQRRSILYNNAARFLRLSPEEIARHHGS